MNEILATLEKDPTLHLTNIVLIFPSESDCLSNMDSANVNDCAKSVNNIKLILNEKAK